MGKIYEKADSSAVSLMEKVAKEHHKSLTEVEARVGLVVVYQEDENSTKPAISKNGAKCAASVKVVNLRDRLTKGYDAEILLDGECWEGCTNERKIAILDHELEHLVPVFDNKTGKPKLDSLERPKLRTRNDDIQFWGFSKIAARHGKNSQEHRCFMEMLKSHGKILAQK